MKFHIQLGREFDRSVAIQLYDRMDKVSKGGKNKSKEP